MGHCIPRLPWPGSSTSLIQVPPAGSGPYALGFRPPMVASTRLSLQLAPPASDRDMMPDRGLAPLQKKPKCRRELSQNRGKKCPICAPGDGPLLNARALRRKFILFQLDKWWARLGLNQRPLRCQRSALPLSYAPFLIPAPAGNALGPVQEKGGFNAFHPAWQGPARGFIAGAGVRGAGALASEDFRGPGGAP